MTTSRLEKFFTKRKDKKENKPSLPSAPKTSYRRIFVKPRLVHHLRVDEIHENDIKLDWNNRKM